MHEGREVTVGLLDLPGSDLPSLNPSPLDQHDTILCEIHHTKTFITVCHTIQKSTQVLGCSFMLAGKRELTVH